MTPRHALVALAVVVAYVASRLALVWRFPAHMDETLFARWALDAYEHPALRFAPLAGGNNPMQEWLGTALISLGIEPLTALRLLSVASGLVLMLVVADLARWLGGPTAVVPALVVWAVLPFSLVYGAIGLTDPLVAACFGVAVVLQIRLARRPRLDAALLLGLVWGVGLLAKLSMVASVVLVPIGLLLIDWRRETLGRRLLRWVGALALAGLVAAALYQVLRLSPLYADAGKAREVYFSMHGVDTFLASPERWIRDNWTSYRLAYRGYLTVPLVVAAAVGLGLVARRTPRPALALLGWGLLPVAAVVALADQAYVRWLYVGVAPLAAFVAVGAREIAVWAARTFGRRLPVSDRIVAVGAFAVLIAPAVLWDVRTLRDPVTQTYPGHDDVDYVLEFSAGGPWPAVVHGLEQVRGRVSVATTGQGFGYVQLALRDRPLVLRDVGERVAPASFLLGIENKHTLVAGPGVLVWDGGRVIPRPRGGVPVRVRQRAVRIQGRRVTTPHALAHALGGRAAFARFVAAHPEVGVWAAAWRRARGASARR